MINVTKIKVKGFSLVELTVVLAIVGIIFFSAIGGMGEKRAVQKQLESEQTLKSLKKSLLKFALINRYLPCPDTDNDGFENRNPDGTCGRDFGLIPYKDVGLTREETFDAYTNNIRYAVHLDADTLANTLSASAASYFGQVNPGDQPIFDLATTPPTSNNVVGANFYTVCTPEVAVCAVGQPSFTQTAVVVLVAYNKIGPVGDNPLSADCAAAAGTPAGDNCDVNNTYHQARLDANPAAGDAFDDVIAYISGYELKSEILSPIVFWTGGPGSINLTPTYRGYNLEQGDYVPQDSASTPDIIQVDRNITTSLDLGDGNDVVSIGNDLASDIDYNNKTGQIYSDGSEADLYAGAGNDTIYIRGSAKSDVILGSGDDRLILGESLTERLEGGTGNDQVWIQDGIQNNSNLDLGDDNDILILGKIELDEFGEPLRDVNDGSYVTSGGDINETISGGDGVDVLVLENMTKSEWESDPAFRSYVSDFEVIIFKADATNSDTREYVSI